MPTSQSIRQTLRSRDQILVLSINVVIEKHCDQSTVSNALFSSTIFLTMRVYFFLVNRFLVMHVFSITIFLKMHVFLCLSLKMRMFLVFMIFRKCMFFDQSIFSNARFSSTIFLTMHVFRVPFF